MITKAKVAKAQRSAQRLYRLIDTLPEVKYIYQFEIAKRYKKARRMYQQWLEETDRDEVPST